MKIVMADPSLFTGRYDDSLCEALARRGHDVRLIARPMRTTDAIRPKRYSYDPRYFRLGEGARGLLGDGLAGRALKGVEYGLDAAFGPVRGFSGDVAHFQWLPFAMADTRLLARLRKRMALVHTVHNAQAYHGDSPVAQGRGYAALLPRFDALIVHGEATRAALEARGMDMSRVHVVAHPPMQLSTAREADLAAVPVPAVVPRILIFGTIRPYKGLDLLIEAAIELWKDGCEFELAIAGKPFMPIEALIGRVRGAGFAHRLITDLAFLTEGRLDAHLSRANIMVFPYRSIDSSGAFLSALRYGAAMVTSDAGMFGELNAGDTARFAAGDAQGLTACLRQLVTDADARKRLGEAALALDVRLGGWDAAALATEKVYEAALAAFAQRSAA